MKIAVLSLIGIALLLSIAPAATFATSPYTSEIVWGNNVEWQMVAPPGLGTSHAATLEPLYVVAPQTSTPQSPADNDHLPGIAHDHVLAPPPANKGGYNPNWEVYIVMCLNHCTGVSLAGTFLSGLPGTLVQTYNGQELTNNAIIQAGIANGDLLAIDSGIHFICIVQPLA